MIKAARRKLEVLMPAAMRLAKYQSRAVGNPTAIWGKQDKNACVVDADESMRQRLEGAVHTPHHDHMTAKGTNSMAHNSLIHKFIPMPRAMKILDAKAAVVKEWEKLEKIPAWQLTKSQKQERSYR